MKATFLGRSPVKFSCNSFCDYRILVEDIKSWPHLLVIKQKGGGEWAMPHKGKQWAIYAIPSSSSSLTAYFGGYEDKKQYHNYYNEYEPPFDITITYENGTTDTISTIDGRIKLTDQEQAQWVADNINSDEWPKAIEYFAGDSEDEKAERGLSILEQCVDTNIKKTNFLDFGCGDGHVAVQSVNFGVNIAVGFDVNHHEEWKSKNSLVFTNDWNKVLDTAPYDVILLYDVLDHADSPEDILNKIVSVAKGTSIIKIRCHPWISRHGGHHYKTINKAFAHLFPSLREKYNIDNPTAKIVDINTYKTWFASAGMIVVSEDVNKQPIDDFFSLPFLKDMIIKDNNIGNINNLEYTFIDYTLNI